MTDLRTLLHESAPTPASPLDMAAVYRRARRLRSRRAAGWLGLAGVTLGLGVPGGSVLVTAGDRDGGEAAAVATTLPQTDLAEASGRATTTIVTNVGPSTGAVTTTRPSGNTAVGASHTGASSGTAGPAGAPTATPTTSGPGGTTPAPPNDDSYPRAASCSVNNDGLGPGQQRSCRFTATTEGGAGRRTYGDEVNGPHGQVLVTRNGTTTARPVTGVNAFAGDIERGCGERFIQPGDLVEVILTNSANGTTQVATIGAGEHWECFGDE